MNEEQHLVDCPEDRSPPHIQLSHYFTGSSQIYLFLPLDRKTRSYAFEYIAFLPSNNAQSSPDFVCPPASQPSVMNRFEGMFTHKTKLVQRDEFLQFIEINWSQFQFSRSISILDFTCLLLTSVKYCYSTAKSCLRYSSPLYTVHAAKPTIDLKGVLDQQQGDFLRNCFHEWRQNVQGSEKGLTFSNACPSF